MAGTLGIVENTYTEVSQLLRSTIHGGKNVTVATGSVISRGMVMGQVTIGKEWVPLDLDAVDGSEIARGILGVRESATLTADTTCYMYTLGEFNEADISWPAGITSDQKATAKQQLEDRGIIIA